MRVRRRAVGFAISKRPARLRVLVASGDLEEAPARVDRIDLVDPKRHAVPEDVDGRVIRAIRRAQHARCHIGVEAFVEVGLLELVRREEPVEVLVPELVDRDALGAVDGGRSDEVRPAGDERRILHPPRRSRAPGGIDHGQRSVRIGSEDPSHLGEGRLHGSEVPLRLRRVLRLEQKAQLDIVEAGLAKEVLENEEVGVGGPREVVHAFLPEAIEVAVSRRGTLLHALPGRSHFAAVARRDVDRDVVVSEVREELAVGVKLMADLVGVLQDADLRKPLGDEEEVSLPAGPPEDAGEPGTEIERDASGLAWRDGARESYFGHRPVVRVAVVRRDEDKGRKQVRAIRERHPRDFDGPPGVRNPVGSARAPGRLPEEGRSRVAEGVQVQMELERRGRVRRAVGPGQKLRPLDGLLFGIQAAGDLVGSRRRNQGGCRHGNRGGQGRARESEKSTSRFCRSHWRDCSMPRVPKKPPPGARPRESGRAALVPPEAARRAEELREELARHERLYYVENRPEITDAQFDVLLRELLALEEKYPELARPDSLTRRVGGRPAESFATVEHATPMLSLENAYAWEEAEAWVPRARRARRGRDEKRPDDPVDPSPDPGDRDDRSAGRGLLHEDGVYEGQRGSGGGGAAALREPSQRRGRDDAAARTRGHRPRASGRVALRDRRRREPPAFADGDPRASP